MGCSCLKIFEIQNEKNSKRVQEEIKDQDEGQDKEQKSSIIPKKEGGEIQEEIQEKKNLEKYRINYLEFKTSFPNTKLKSLCPKCVKVPDIRLGLNSEKEHYVKCKELDCRYCYCCYHPYTKTLDDYISLMAKIQRKNIKCEIHKEKGEYIEGCFSCELCQKWMCEECMNNHLKEKREHYLYEIQKIHPKPIYTNCYLHDYKEFKLYVTENFMWGYHRCELCDLNNDDLIPDFDVIEIPKEKGECLLKQLKELIKDGVEYLDIYCQNIYNILIKSIESNNPQFLENATKIYDNFLIRNRRALFYYQMVVNTATPSVTNYNLISNMSALLETKFDKLNFNLSEKLNNEEINSILEFFKNNYIVGKEEKKLVDLKNFTLKEICKNVKDKNTDNEKDKIKENENHDEEKNKITYTGIIVLGDNIVCACSEDGYIHSFKIDNNFLGGKQILTIKAHEKEIISSDNIKNSTDLFITCNEKDIKLWSLNKNNNDYKIILKLCLKDISQEKINYLYCLNSSNISFVNEERKLIVLNDQSYKPFILFSFYSDLTGIYQIESKDDNNGKLIVSSDDEIMLMNIFQGYPPIKTIGAIRCRCFSGKSLFYWEKDMLLVGGVGEISIVNIKSLKLEYIIKASNSECTCFLRINDGILCGYGDTSSCHCWRGGIAVSKNTKFLIVKKKNEKYEIISIKDIFYDYGITNALWIDGKRFIGCFYNDDALKIFETN